MAIDDDDDDFDLVFSSPPVEPMSDEDIEHQIELLRKSPMAILADPKVMGSK